MPTTYTTYTGDGATTTFAVPFPFINSTHVYATVDEVLTSITITGGNAEFSVAPANSTAIVIYRATPLDESMVTFASRINDTDLNVSRRQVIYALEEYIESASDPNAPTPTDGTLLPVVSAADNGKVMVVAGGIWTSSLLTSLLGTSAVLNTGTTDGTIPVIGTGDKLATALIDTGTTGGTIPVIGTGDKLATALIDTGSTDGQVVVVGTGDKIDPTIVFTAYGLVSSTGTLSQSTGISSAVRNSTGHYTITLDTAQSASPFPVMATVRNSNDRTIGFVAVSTTQFDIYIHNASTNALADANFAVMVPA